MGADDDDPVPLTERVYAPLYNTSRPRDNEPDPSDLDRLRKWQEQRIERKLRGEYESILLRLGELINDNKDTPMRISSVRVDGAINTRPSFLHWLFESHLSRAKSDDATLDDVLKSTKRLTNLLLETDVFQYVLPRLEESKDVLASPGDIELIFQTHERGKYFLKTATEVGNQEGSAGIQAHVRNAFGGAEIVEGELSSGSRTRLAGHVSVSAPLTPDLRTRGELSVFGFEKDWTAFSSCVEGVRSVRAAIKTTNRKTTSEVAYEATLRHIHALTEGASLSIREAAGSSVKSALSHSWIYESRDDRAIPSRGGYFRTYNEIAGLGGDTAHLKSQASFQLARKVLPNSRSSLAFLLSGRAGCLHGLGSNPTRFNDRFQLGGPLDVRMFKQHGLGARDGSDALGGELFWALGASVISDMPRKPNWPVKLHGFVNTGRLDSLNKDVSFAESIRSCISRPCVSAGVGLLYRLGPARVELNFGVPLVANKTDSTRRGFQLGVGVDFL